MLVVGAGRFFSLLIGHCLLVVISGKDSLAHAASNNLSPFSLLLHRKDSSAPAVLAGHYFLPFPIQPHLLILLFMVRAKIASLETFQSNMTKPHVTSNVMLFHGFRSAAKRDLTLAHMRLSKVVALCLYWRSRKFYKFKRQPF